MPHDPYRYFRPEARNLLDQFAQGVLELEKNGASAGAVQRLLRLAHTLKGAARVVRQSAIADRAHAIEDALAPFRDSAVAPGRDSIDAILAHLDAIGGDLAGLAPGHDDGSGAPDQPAVAANGAAAPPSAAAEAPRTIRAEIAEMDAVLDGVTQTQAGLGSLRRSAAMIGEAGHLVDVLGAQWRDRAGSEHGGRHDGAAATAIVDELRRSFAGAAQGLDTSIARIDRELRQLRDAAEGLRLVAIDTLFAALSRTARDAAHALGKQVDFDGQGGEIRLDADVLGILQGALIQIVRNAVAHGIESGSERAAAGKPAAGRIRVEATRRGSNIAFVCSDDGRGIDPAAVRRVAVERGVLNAAAGEPSTEQLMRLLLRGGISTAASVTDMAGRGVGLDIVREALERIGGDIAIRFEPGRGTTFELVIPRSVTAVDALLVSADGDSNAIAIPLDAVQRTVRLKAGDIARAGTGPSILYRQTAIPFLPLRAVMRGMQRSSDAAQTWLAIIVAGGGGVAAFGVERLLGTARIVVRPLPERLDADPVIAGASLDGDGKPQLVLDPDRLVAAAHASPHDGASAAASDPAPQKRPVLVVDDSLTTRMLEQSILQSAGYDVDVASSAEEALDLVRQKPFSLILCDVEMPGIDGFTFVERIRADAALRDIPAILVSSRSAPEDRARGREVGAHGYIVKGEFDQAKLLTMIRPMVG
jgi:two-component system chemotaxis sensor kinase CheA